MNRTPEEKLTGRLMGLARATDGNDHLRNPGATAVILEGLRILANGEAVTEDLLQRIEDEKRKMIPDCFLCASPCGKNRDYDMENLAQAPEAVRQLKIKLLHTAGELAARGIMPERNGELYYQVLIAMGLEDYGVEDLDPILRALERLGGSKI